jgi:PKD repeat protein
MVENWEIEKRTKKSQTVLEGTITNQKTSWDNQKRLIHTIHTVQISRVFKGKIENKQIQIATEGGFLDDVGLKVYPSLELKIGQSGVFFLNKDHNKLFGEKVYIPSASSQSFILYDFNDFSAYDGHKKYLSIPFELYPEIKKASESDVEEINPFRVILDPNVITPLSTPVITGINVDTATGGTDFNIVISGQNFGLIEGQVGFRDANYGDNRFFYPLASSYINWSDNQIEVRVPSRAGTGTIQVITANGNTVVSTKALFVKWSHSNVTYSQTTDTQYYQPRLTATNNSGGKTWSLNSNFAANIDATNAFLRALVDWRCETGMNWDIGQNTTVDDVARDEINIVRFTEYDDSKLGVCYSWYSGCNQAGVFQWFVSELDIEFDSNRNWHFDTNNPPNNKHDFQSVALHELGHGVQMAHVRDNSKVMHYSIQRGTRKTTLVKDDIDGGLYVVNRSKTAVCNRQSITVVPNDKCVIGVPNAALSINAVAKCVNVNIIFTNETKETVNTYIWNFGAGANPMFSSSPGPHTVRYSSHGRKNIRLTVINDFGQDVLDTFVIIEPNQIDNPALELPESICYGISEVTVPIVDNAQLYSWNISSNGAFIENNDSNFISIDWKSGEKAFVSVRAIGECAESDIVLDSALLFPKPEPLFDYDNDNGTVTFMNQSNNADNYLWDFGDGNQSSDENPSHFFPSNGSYDVILTAISSCGSDSIEKEVMIDLHVGINAINLAHTNIYPNPVKSGGIIHFKVKENPIHINLIAMDGKTISIKDFQQDALELPNISGGVYTLTIQTATQNYRSLVIIE